MPQALDLARRELRKHLGGPRLDDGAAGFGHADDLSGPGQERLSTNRFRSGSPRPGIARPAGMAIAARSRPRRTSRCVDSLVVALHRSASAFSAGSRWGPA